ncbi:metallophosphoesterase [uncultured Enterococcus sp.]|uniref:metallophosphoesterase family protein n=1 Tax=uncultured Enterococcus sp. TaxID=167972 RepID=UPI002AA723C0|nr:metallophosphoesterase [uncultured Enterococcus sp.]
MNLLHISDIHFRREYEACEEGYKGMLSLMKNPLIQLEQCLQQVMNQETVDLVIISGDLTEDGEIEDYRFLKKWLQSVLGDIEIVVTLGNHDIKENFRVGWCEEAASDLPYNHVSVYPEFTIVSFDNSAYGQENGVVSEEQFQWLGETLEALHDKPVMLVTHHHLLTQQSSMPKWPGTERFLKLIDSSNVLCILNGHTHHSYLGTINGVPYFTVASMSFAGDDLGEGIVRFENRCGYNLYQFEQGKMLRQISETKFSGQVLKVLDMRT